MRKFVLLMTAVALFIVGSVLGGSSIAGAAGEAASSANSPNASAGKKAVTSQRRRARRGPRGPRGRRGRPGATGPQGPAGPPGAGSTPGAVPTVPLVFKAPANTSNTILLDRSGLRVEASCTPAAGGTTALTGRSLADNAVVRATGVQTGSASAVNDFDSNATVDLLPGAATENYSLTYLSAANGVLTANYANVNKAGGSQLGDCVIYGVFTLG